MNGPRRRIGTARDGAAAQAATRWTGMPSFVALSIRFSVMPLPGKAMRPLGKEVEEVVVAAEGRGLSVAVPVGLAHHLVDAVPLGPLRGDLLDAGTAAVDEDHVGVLGAGLVEASGHRAGVGDGLAACDGDEGSVGQVCAALAVLAGALEVACVDGCGGEVPGPAGVTAVPRAPDLAGLGAVGVGGGVAHLLEGVAAVAEVPRPVGDEFEFAGVDLCAVLGAFEVAHPGREPIDGAVEAEGLVCACSMLTKPQRRLSRSSASWKPSGVTPSAMMRNASLTAARASSRSQTSLGSCSPGSGVAPKSAAFSQIVAVTGGVSRVSISKVMMLLP